MSPEDRRHWNDGPLSDPADRDGVVEAYDAACEASARSQAVSDVNAALLTELQIIEHARNEVPTTSN